MSKDKFPIFDRHAGTLMFITGCSAFILAVCAVVGISSWFFQMLWNYVVAGIFWTSGPVLTYWQSVLTVCLIWFVGRILRIGKSVSKKS